MGTISPRIAETNHIVASRPQGTARTGIDAQGTATECRDRDSQIIGIIRAMASQPPTPHDMEEVQERDIEFDWENETIEQWAYARRDTMSRELFQAPCTGTPQHWNELHYHQARRARQQVLDLRNTQQEVESQLLMHHLHVVRSQNLSGLALEQAQDEVMQIYGHHLEREVEPFWDYLRAI